MNDMDTIMADAPSRAPRGCQGPQRCCMIGPMNRKQWRFRAESIEKLNFNHDKYIYKY